MYVCMPPNKPVYNRTVQNSPRFPFISGRSAHILLNATLTFIWSGLSGADSAKINQIRRPGREAKLLCRELRNDSGSLVFSLPTCPPPSFLRKTGAFPETKYRTRVNKSYCSVVYFSQPMIYAM